MSDQELTVVDRQLPNPFTGEAVDLDADAAVLADVLRSMKQLEEEKRLFVRAVTAEVLTRMDRDAKWTIHFPGLDLVSQSPGRVEYNGEALKKILEQLVEEGAITREAALAAIERKVSYSARKRGVDALKKLGGDVAGRLRSAERRIPDDKRYVSVKVNENVVDA